MYISDYGVNGMYIHVSEDLRLQEGCHVSCSIVLNIIPKNGSVSLSSGLHNCTEKTLSH